jgi:hypothetical protein
MQHLIRLLEWTAGKCLVAAIALRVRRKCHLPCPESDHEVDHLYAMLVVGNSGDCTPGKCALPKRVRFSTPWAKE